MNLKIKVIWSYQYMKRPLTNWTDFRESILVLESGTRGNVTQCSEGYILQTYSSIILNKKRKEIFKGILLKSGMALLTLPTPFWYRAESSRQSSKSREGNQRDANGKRSQIVIPFCMLYDTVHMRSQKFHWKLPETMNNFSKVAGYKISLKSVVFLHTNKNHTEKKIMDTVQFTIL